jgi:hypothetical protein
MFVSARLRYTKRKQNGTPLRRPAAPLVARDVKHGGLFTIPGEWPIFMRIKDVVTDGYTVVGKVSGSGPVPDATMAKYMGTFWNGAKSMAKTVAVYKGRRPIVG